MSSLDSYVKEITSIKKELKRIGGIGKKLRAQKKKAEERLRLLMERQELESYNGIKLKSITPRPPKPKKKSVAQRKSDAIELFRTIGVPDPVSFWDDFETTQKIAAEESSN